MFNNCLRFAPRDSVPGLISKICKYLKDHPGWSEVELEEQIKKFISATGVESFNGRTGNVVLDKNDVNNLMIASAYFAEGNESIDSLDLVSLYNQGVRFVFTDFNSEKSGYNLAFVLDYFDSSGNVVYYPMTIGSGGDENIISVNGKTGVVELSLADIIGTSGAQVKLCTSTEFTSTTTETWNAHYKDGYRIVVVVNDSSTAVDYLYILKQDENNHIPIGVSTGSSDAYTPNNPPPYPVTSVNGKTGEVSGLYDVNNPPPYPVTSVNGKAGEVSGLYDANNPPPYPVTSVDGKTGAVESYTMLGTRKVFGNTDPLVFIDPDGKIGGIHDGVPYYCYSQLLTPPYPKEIGAIEVTLYPNETDTSMRYIVPSTITKYNLISVVLIGWTVSSGWPSYYSFVFSEKNGLYGFDIIQFSFHPEVSDKAMMASVYNDDTSKGVVVRFYYTL